MSNLQWRFRWWLADKIEQLDIPELLRTSRATRRRWREQQEEARRAPHFISTKGYSTAGDGGAHIIDPKDFGALGD